MATRERRGVGREGGCSWEGGVGLTQACSPNSPHITSPNARGSISSLFWFTPEPHSQFLTASPTNPLQSLPATSGHTNHIGNTQTVTAHSTLMSRVTGRSSVSTTSSLLPTHSSASSMATTPVPSVTSSPATSSASSSVATPVHEGTSAKATTTPVGKGTPSSVPSHHSDTPTTPASHRTRTTASSTNGSLVTLTSSSRRLSFFFLSFRILNLQFNSSLEDPHTNYYQVLQRNVTELVSNCPSPRAPSQQLRNSLNPCTKLSPYPLPPRFCRFINRRIFWAPLI